MLDDSQRYLRYVTQTLRRNLAPRQRRRIKHKIGHQSRRFMEYADRRAERTAAMIRPS